MSILQNKKVAIFLPNFGGGGAEKVMIIIANELSKECKVDLVVVRATGTLRTLVDSKVNLIDLKGKRVITSLLRLIKYLRMHRPIYLVSALVTSNIISVLAKKISKVNFKLILSEHAVASEAIADSPSRTYRFFIKKLIRLIYPLADQIVTVSEGVSSDLENKFGIPKKMLNVIYNPVVSSEILSQSEESLNNPYFDHNNIPMILGVGRLTSQKNFTLLIKSFSLLLKFKKAKLVILGKGPMLNELKNLTQDLNLENDVYFVGFEKNPYRWMKNAKLFVLSSSYEGLGNVLIESMACGTKVVSTDCPSGPSEILEGGKWGKLCQIGDVNALSKAMIESLSEEDNLDITQRASYFNYERTIQGYKELIKKIDRVTIFLPSLGGGGAERAMLTVANGLSEEHSVDLVVSNASGEYLKEIGEKVNLVDLNSKSLRYSFFKLRKYLNTDKPKTVISVLTSANILISIVKFFSQSSFKLILSERAAVTMALSDNPRWQARISPFLIRRLYKHADQVVSVSKAISEELITQYGVRRNKTSVIYNAVVDDKLIEKSNEQFINPYFDHNKIPMILGVGRLTSQKDFPTLLKSFSILRKKEISKLVILGEGELLSKLKELTEQLQISEDVYFPGFVNNPYIWMKNSKLFVLSSAYEGLPNALIQAMACGTSVISTDCPTGPAEILESGKWGKLVSVGDEKELADAMISYFKEENKIDVFKRAAYFSTNRAIRSYKQLI